MSGPKVVRIVTREEIIAICERQIATLKAAVAQWQKVGERNGVLAPEDIEIANSRVTAMQQLLAADKFVELQKQVPLEIGFLASDLDRRVAAVAERKAAARKEARQLVRAAASLSSALAEKGLVVPPALLRPETTKHDDLREAVRQGFGLLQPSAAPAAVTDRQRDLASRLAGDDKRSNLAEWLAGQERQVVDEPGLLIVERRYEELQALDPEVSQAFADRLDKLATDDSNRRSLLIDSLALDIRNAHKAAVAKAAAIAELRGIEAELKFLGDPAVEPHLQAINRLLAQKPDLSEFLGEIASSKDALLALVERRAAIERRRAILTGLADLGYEVKEGMETAWVENGRVVLKSTKSPSYGVEVGGNPSASMQVRTVGFENSGIVRNTVGDIAAETEFCGDFTKLQARLAADGGALEIVKAMGIGTTAVKTVAMDSEAGDVAEVRRATPGTLSRQ
ncbi:hypothetical protein [Neorhizobium tomejilense]|uniref:hypothetical protein n=1 Tax=Neorhizobium tomejilense TaxID=2093828 RepID=UPI000CFA5164|nr:hypothetical protein [Neorhizobium tomejilense]